MAMLVESREHALLFDAGPRYSAEADAGARVIAPYLRWRGIERLDLLVISHRDSDRSGGTTSLLKNLPVERVWTSIRADHPTLKGAKQIARCEDGQALRLGTPDLRMLGPLASDYERRSMTTNAMSCVLEVRSGPHRVLLSGDLPAREEARLIERYSQLRTTLVIAPHHGSRSSSSEPFLEATRPAWVVYQAGYRNRFGHPAAEVAARSAAAEASAVRTDSAGAVQWRLRANGKIEVDAMRAHHVRYWHDRPGPPLPGTGKNDEVPAYEAEPQVEPVQPFGRELAFFLLD
jgi:competence protein ComEC